MQEDRGFPNWEELYRKGDVEKLPWYCASLDPDLEAALARYDVSSGVALDQGTGPGTQAIELAARGFEVTATDVSAAALEYAARRAEERGVLVHFVRDDVLTSALTGPFDLVFDRGCFHVLAPEQRASDIASLARLLGASGWLFLKCFSHLQPGEGGPYRFTPDQIRETFPADRFEVMEVRETVYQGQFSPNPRALFCVIRRRAGS